MDIWICHTAVTYGRREYTPDAEDEKNRIIKLPVNTEVDDTIKAHFTLFTPGGEVKEPEEPVDSRTVKEIERDYRNELRERLEGYGIKWKHTNSIATLEKKIKEFLEETD